MYPNNQTLMFTAYEIIFYRKKYSLNVSYYFPYFSSQFIQLLYKCHQEKWTDWKIKCMSPKLTLTNNLVGNGGKTYSLNSKLVESARCCLLWQHVLCTPCIHKTFLLLDIQGPQNACISWVFVWKKCSSKELLWIIISFIY